MANPAAPPAPSPADTYRPLSLLAVIGVGISILSLTIYLLGSEWLIFIPLLGFVISAVSLLRIKRSDNALAGAGLARFGMAVSLVVALSWITMQVTMILILQAESTAFLERWLECVRDGKDGLAFIATARPGNRPFELKAEDLEPRALRARYPSPAGPAYDLFLATPIAELLLRGGKEISWERIGTPEYFYDQGNWYFKHRYRLHTPEAALDILFTTVSDQVDRPSGPRREWRVDLMSSEMLRENMETTPFGAELTQARGEAVRAMTLWIGQIGFAKKEEAMKRLQGPPALVADFEKLYAALRQGDTEGFAPKLNKGRPPLVLKASKDGNKWQLVLRSTIEAGPRDVDCQITLENNEPNGELERWRIVDLKYLGDRKRPEATAPGPNMPAPPQ